MPRNFARQLGVMRHHWCNHTMYNTPNGQLRVGNLSSNFALKLGLFINTAADDNIAPEPNILGHARKHAKIYRLRERARAPRPSLTNTSATSTFWCSKNTMSEVLDDHRYGSVRQPRVRFQAQFTTFDHNPTLCKRTLVRCVSAVADQSLAWLIPGAVDHITASFAERVTGGG